MTARPDTPAATEASASAPLLEAVLHRLDEEQAQEVVTIDLAGKSNVADHMVIASGRSTRQGGGDRAETRRVAQARGGHGPVRLEGLPQADWVLLDAGDVVVHLFRPEVRSFYNLERMWAFGDGPPAARA